MIIESHKSSNWLLELISFWGQHIIQVVIILLDLVVLASTNLLASFFQLFDNLTIFESHLDADHLYLNILLAW